MNTTDQVHQLSVSELHRRTAERPARAASHQQLAAPVRGAILRARHFLQGEQRFDGCWAGRKSGDVALLGQLVLLFAYFGREGSVAVRQAIRAIERDQRSNGGWALAPDGPIDLSASVLAYFALKVAGNDASLANMRQSRQAIRDLGGADAADAKTRLWLALLGQVDYDCCRPIAPEWLVMPEGSMRRAFGSDATASDRRRLAAWAVIWSLRPQCHVEVARGVRELFVNPISDWPAPGSYLGRATDRPRAGWSSRLLNLAFRPLRARAIDRAASLLASPLRTSDSEEPDREEMIWQRIALDALELGGPCPDLVACDRLLRCLVADEAESDESESLPTVSLTVDTALAVEALQLSGAQAVQPPVIDGLNWLADSGRRRDYETTNTREVVAVLRALARPHEGGIGAVLPPEIHLTPDRLGRRFRRARGPHARRIQLRRLRERLCQELLSRQQPDGGWSAWNDPHPSRRSRGVIRAADGSPQQDSAPDATGNIVEVLALHGLRLDHPAFGRAVAYLRMAQQADGSWDSATGARFIHGTGWAVRGLVAAGSAKGDSAVAAGVNWLLVQQHESGGWGEAVVRADDERDAITAAATAIQTAWALLALITAGHLDHEATRRGVEFLLDAQRDDGNWFDSQFTQRDSASGSWYRNDLYSTALPLIALARWARAIGDIRDAPTPCLRLVCDESPA